MAGPSYYTGNFSSSYMPVISLIPVSLPFDAVIITAFVTGIYTYLHRQVAAVAI